MIKACNCKSEFQDQLYGKGMRVHTQSKPKDKETPGELRCTICSGSARWVQRLIGHARMWLPIHGR